MKGFGRVRAMTSRSPWSPGSIRTACSSQGFASSQNPALNSVSPNIRWAGNRAAAYGVNLHRGAQGGDSARQIALGQTQPRQSGGRFGGLRISGQNPRKPRLRVVGPARIEQGARRK